MRRPLEIGRAGCAAAAAAGLGLAGVAQGQIWDESRGGDAGAFVHDAQVPVGEGPLEAITGELEGAERQGDFQDMFAIFISDPANFSARATGEFNSMLWLVQPDARGLLGNNDDPGATAPGPSLLLQFANDGTGAGVTSRGVYYIAISGFESVPTAAGLDIFSFATRTEISGPDGPGGSLPHDGWDSNGEFGRYRIDMTGVSFVPGPGGLAVAALGGLWLCRRRRGG